jgi:transcriptional regulator with XRE-family HTH domain
MADHLSAYRTSYYRYESGETAPQIFSLYKLGNKFGISLDWLILNRGQMQFTKMEAKKEETASAAPKSTQEIFSSPDEEVKRLLDFMKRFPLLRHEVMVTFYKYLEENKEMVGSVEPAA